MAPGRGSHSMPTTIRPEPWRSPQPKSSRRGDTTGPSPEPLGLSSSFVVSVAPTALRATLAAHPDAPVYVIGGGKTAMDTVIEVLNAGGAREIGMLVGKGTDFFNRNQNLPTGFQRWTTGRPTSRIFHEMAWIFNGDNETKYTRIFGHHRHRS